MKGWLFGNTGKMVSTIRFDTINLVAVTEDQTKFWHEAYHVTPGQNYSGGASFLTIGRNNNSNIWFDQWSAFLGYCSGDTNGGFAFNPFKNKIQVFGGVWNEIGTVWKDEIVLQSQLTSTTYCADNSLITEAIFN